jgi:hypothetical protein
LLRDEGRITEEITPDLAGYLSIDLQVLFDRDAGEYAIGDIFGNFNAGIAIASRGDSNWNIVAGMVFFTSIWGLSEGEFRRIAQRLIAHESRRDLLSREQLTSEGLNLGNSLLDSLSNLVKFIETEETARERQRRQLRVLLLPYWKDRWFLYEVWTLLRPLTDVLDAGGEIHLVGLSSISEAGVEGSTWNLPTQKAKEPVAVLKGPKGSLRLWFQRETSRLSSGGHMEPDVRLTADEEPFDDLAIIECKDRVKFAAGGLRVAKSYLKDSTAREVWVVNYEEPTDPKKRIVEKEIDSRRFGIVEGFRPGTYADPIDACLLNLFTEYLGVSSEHTSGDSHRVDFIVIDVSGSMGGKFLPPDIVGSDPTRISPQYVKAWSETVREADAATMRSISRGEPLQSAGAENPDALRNFASGLPDGTRITLVTDDSGFDRLNASGALDKIENTGGHVSGLLSGKPIYIVILK